MDTGVIRAVEITGTLRSAVLVKAEQIKIPGDAIVEGVVENIETVAGALKDLWTRFQIGSREVVVGVSNPGVLMRLVDLPKIELSKLDKLLRFQAGDYFPIPLSEMVMDYAVVGENQGETSPQLEVLMVAVRQDMLDKSLQALSTAALIPKIVDAAPLALMRTVPESRLTGTAIFADISLGLTSLMLVIGGIPRFVRIIPTNLQAASAQDFFSTDIVLEAKRQVASTDTGESLSDSFFPDDLIKEAEEQLSITHMLESETDKLSPKDINLDQQQEVVIPKAQADENITDDVWYRWAGLLVEEIISSIGYYLDRRDSLTVDCLFLSGQGSHVEGVADLMHTELDVPVEVINPLKSFIGAVNTRNIDWSKEGPDFAVAVGLALRGMVT